MPDGPTVDITVVIPSYNSAPYLDSTLDACAAALARTSWRAEIVVVDDGSNDGTDAVLARIADRLPVPVRVLSQPNSGRFLARWAGLEAATGELVLLLDSRVLLAPGSLHHIEATLAQDPGASVWNGHAVTDPAAPLVGHFWEVPTHVFWGAYLAHPRPVSFGLADFNRYPKGTGVFLAPRDVLVRACLEAWPEADAALSSDDTKVIRGIAAHLPIRLDPEFTAVYRPRTNARAFVRHSFGRGTFLVDSFGGTSRSWTVGLVALALAPVLGLAVLVGLAVAGAWSAVVVVAILALLAALLPAGIAAVRRCPPRGLLAYLLYLPLFVLPYWFGLLRGLVVHGRHVVGPSTPPATRALT
jgi:hypothetical protein